MRKHLFLILTLCCLFLLPAVRAEEPALLENILEEIELAGAAWDALSVGPASFALSEDRQSIFIGRPEVSGSSEYTIAYNLYDSAGNPVNYFYSLEDRVAVTPGYGGLFNVFIVVTDKATGAQDTQNIGWQTVDWPHADTLTVGKAPFRLSQDKKTIFIDRPEIRCRSGKVTIAYNIYDSNGSPVNYFYSDEAHVAATPGYDGLFNVFVVVTDPETGEQNVQDVGWQQLGEAQPPEEQEWPAVINGIHYDLVDGKVTVTGVSDTETELRFVDKVYGMPVTVIADSAFRGFANATGALVLPAQLTCIGDRAFEGCSYLTGSLVIPDGVTYIGANAFHNDIGFNGTLTLSASLTEIGAQAFLNCTDFTGPIVIPDSVTVIGDSAFMRDAGFTGLTLSANLTRIGVSAFERCTGLKGDLAIPAKVAVIGEKAFMNCSALDGTLTLPDGLANIGSYAFDHCGRLRGAMKIPGAMTVIPDYLFNECYSLTGALTIPAGVTSIGNNAFQGCTGLNGALTIPESVTQIEYGAFNHTTILHVKSGSYAETRLRDGLPNYPQDPYSNYVVD